MIRNVIFYLFLKFLPNLCSENRLQKRNSYSSIYSIHFANWWVSFEICASQLLFKLCRFLLTLFVLRLAEKMKSKHINDIEYINRTFSYLWFKVPQCPKRREFLINYLMVYLKATTTSGLLLALSSKCRTSPLSQAPAIQKNPTTEAKTLHQGGWLCSNMGPNYPTNHNDRTLKQC